MSDLADQLWPYLQGMSSVAQAAYKEGYAAGKLAGIRQAQMLVEQRLGGLLRNDDPLNPIDIEQPL